VKNKIAFEEHFVIKGEEFKNFVMDFNSLATTGAKDLPRQLLDTETERLDIMDKSGIAYSILSFTSPGAQGEPDTQRAIDGSRKVNDFLANNIVRTPLSYLN
jgi:hypothetical protein